MVATSDKHWVGLLVGLMVVHLEFLRVALLVVTSVDQKEPLTELTKAVLMVETRAMKWGRRRVESSVATMVAWRE